MLGQTMLMQNSLIQAASLNLLPEIKLFVFNQLKNRFMLLCANYLLALVLLVKPGFSGLGAGGAGGSGNLVAPNTKPQAFSPFSTE